jgi:surface protein
MYVGKINNFRAFYNQFTYKIEFSCDVYFTIDFTLSKFHKLVNLESKIYNCDLFNKFITNCINFNQSLNSWDIRLVNNTSQMFYGCTLFNGNISSWQTVSVTDMLGMFRLASNFNQDISAWDTTDVTTMRGMFYEANAFNQNIGNWDVSNVNDVQTGFINFMFGKTFANYSTTNYDALLNGWASRPVQPNQSISFGTIKRTIASDAAKLVLTSAPNNWTIVDGGL